jgi:trehalose 6-phosphate phosphatase
MGAKIMPSKKPTYLFSKKGLQELERILILKPLIAFDLDGTLVNIQPGSGDVVVETLVKDELAKISGYLPVAIVSGRAMIQLERIFSKSAFLYVGNHGLEGVVPISQTKRKTFERRIASIKKFLEDRFSKTVKNLEIEDKKISLTLLFDQSDQAKKDRKTIIRAIEKSKSPIRLVLGKDVLNCLPSQNENKGTSVLQLKKHLKKEHVIFAGDDVTDEDVFKVKNRNLFTIKVGRSKTSAKFYVNDQSEIVNLILEIGKFLMPSHLDGLK